MKLSMKITSGFVFGPTALHVKEIDRLQGFLNGVVCCGNAKGYCVNEVVAVARAVTGRQIPGAIEGRRAGGLALLVADFKKYGRSCVGVRNMRTCTG
jgi:UDP-glucose 4-epimerase